MTVAFVFESDQVTQSDYDELMKSIDRESLQAPLPGGLLAHLAGAHPSGTGWRVIDIWDSRQAADAFYGSPQFAAVSAAAERVNMAITPWPLHRVEIGGRVAQID